MTRDLGQLSSGTFDLLVVGGGIYGLAAAYDAAARGLRVALVERHDLGSGTSFNHHKTLHGGLRYLQTLDLGRMRESIRERRAFARIAAPFVAPQPFVLPTSPSPTRGRLAMRVALAADRLIGADRNRGLDDAHRLPAGRVVSRDELARLVPEARLEHATGAALWYDYLTEESERLTLAFALAAARHGAVLANYVDAIAPIHDGARVAGMQVRDAVTGDALEVRASVTVNAAGAGAGRVMAAFGVRRSFPLLKAMNVVTRRPGGRVALGCPTAEGRLLVALPWHGRLMVGTSHGDDLCGADQTLVNEGEVLRFLAEVNSAFPWLALTLDDVTLVHRGMVPASIRVGQPPSLVDRAEVRDHAKDGVEGAVSVVGVKYTTARGVAERAIDLVCTKLGRRSTRSVTAERTLIEGQTTTGLERWYGSDAALVREAAAADPALAAPVAPGSEVIGAQLVHAVRHEMALTLEDVVVRRTALGAAGHPGDAVVHGCVEVLRRELGWSTERAADEVASLRRFYEIGKAAPVEAAAPALTAS